MKDIKNNVKTITKGNQRVSPIFFFIPPLCLPLDEVKT